LLFTIISDSHSQHRKLTIPTCDFLIHCGDIGFDYAIQDDFFEWFAEQPARYKCFVLGNHDRAGEWFEGIIKEQAAKYNLIYLHHNLVDTEGIKIYGSNYTPRFGDWAWMKKRGLPLHNEWENIPAETNILVSHGPPYGIRDKTPYGELVGCEELRDRINELPELKMHCFGHIHHSHGVSEISGITYINASSCTEKYEIKNQSIQWEY
jgi:Icc-related predicted phosphoesterase